MFIKIGLKSNKEVCLVQPVHEHMSALILSPKAESDLLKLLLLSDQQYKSPGCYTC